MIVTGTWPRRTEPVQVEQALDHERRVLRLKEHTLVDAQRLEFVDELLDVFGIEVSDLGEQTLASKASRNTVEYDRRAG